MERQSEVGQNAEMVGPRSGLAQEQPSTEASEHRIGRAPEWPSTETAEPWTNRVPEWLCLPGSAECVPEWLSGRATVVECRRSSALERPSTQTAESRIGRALKLQRQSNREPERPSAEIEAQEPSAEQARSQKLDIAEQAGYSGRHVDLAERLASTGEWQAPE